MLAVLRFYIRIFIVASFLSFKINMYPSQHSFDNFAIASVPTRVKNYFFILKLLR